MKKILIISLLSAAQLLCAQAERNSFYIKVKAGNPEVVEKICADTFGENFHFGTRNMVFTIEASNADKLKFLDMLKEAGLQVESTNNASEYVVTVAETTPRNRIYSVDTSSFSPELLVEIQKLLGNTVKGGRADKVRINDADVAQIKLALDKMGLACEFTETAILIGENVGTVIAEFDPAYAAQIRNIVSEYGGNVRELGDGKVRFDIKQTRFAEFAEKLKTLPFVERVDFAGGDRINIVSKTPSVYEVRVYVSSAKDARKLAEQMRGGENFSIKDAYADTAGGMFCARFKVESLTATDTEISERFAQYARKTSKFIRPSDIKINKKQ